MIARPDRRQLGVAAGVTVILAVFAYLLYGGIDRNLVYFLTPTELLARSSSYDVPLRVGGQVAPGSIEWSASTLDLRFVVTDGSKQIRVHSRGAPPQMFHDGMGVVLEGHYAHTGVFESTNLMVKHSNEYRPPKPGEAPSEMYKTLVHEVSN